MFTGLIEEVGEVVAVENTDSGRRFTIRAEKVLEGLKSGDSIAVDGVCQTVVERANGTFQIEAVGETLVKTTMERYSPGRKVNLETALKIGDRLGGHFVQGHVNNTGRVTGVRPRAENFLLEIKLPPELSQYTIPEGSIAIDGVSLTIAHLDGAELGINVIPHTARHTTLGLKKAGDAVNIEVDMLARYLEKLVQYRNQTKISNGEIL